MPDFPIKFEVSAKAESGISVNWSAKENDLPSLNCSIPAVFHGKGDGYTPEGLFGMSIINCIIALYKILCDKNNVNFADLDAQAHLTMDHASSENSLCITEVNFSIHVSGASDKTKAKQLLEKAIHQCPISNSIKSGKTFTIEVN